MGRKSEFCPTWTLSTRTWLCLPFNFRWFCQAASGLLAGHWIWEAPCTSPTFKSLFSSFHRYRTFWFGSHYLNQRCQKCEMLSTIVSEVLSSGIFSSDIVYKLELGCSSLSFPCVCGKTTMFSKASENFSKSSTLSACNGFMFRSFSIWLCTWRLGPPNFPLCSLIFAVAYAVSEYC